RRPRLHPRQPRAEARRGFPIALQLRLDRRQRPAAVVGIGVQAIAIGWAIVVPVVAVEVVRHGAEDLFEMTQVTTLVGGLGGAVTHHRTERPTCGGPDRDPDRT